MTKKQNDDRPLAPGGGVQLVRTEDNGTIMMDERAVNNVVMAVAEYFGGLPDDDGHDVGASIVPSMLVALASAICRTVVMGSSLEKHDLDMLMKEAWENEQKRQATRQKDMVSD